MRKNKKLHSILALFLATLLFLFLNESSAQSIRSWGGPASPGFSVPARLEANLQIPRQGERAVVRFLPGGPMILTDGNEQSLEGSIVISGEVYFREYDNRLVFSLRKIERLDNERASIPIQGWLIGPDGIQGYSIPNTTAALSKAEFKAYLIISPFDTALLK